MNSKIKVLDKGYVRLVDRLGSDLSIVNAARVSYDKESEEFDVKDEKLLAFLIREGHTSPLRHAALTFEVYAPLMVARQWWKYVVASSTVDDQNGWNESSRRYITEQEEFYIPKASEWRSKPDNSKQGSGPTVKGDLGKIAQRWLEESIHQAEQRYKHLLAWGVAPEQARLFLPAYSMYVRWRWTASLASVLHFLQQRLEHDAQQEIQQYAKAVATFVEETFPITYKEWNEYGL